MWRIIAQRTAKIAKVVQDDMDGTISLIWDQRGQVKHHTTPTIRHGLAGACSDQNVPSIMRVTAGCAMSMRRLTKSLSNLYERRFLPRLGRP